MSSSRRRLLALSLAAALSAACDSNHAARDTDAAADDAEVPDEDEDGDVATPDADAAAEAGLVVQDAEADAALDAGVDASTDANTPVPGVIPGTSFADARRIEANGDNVLVNERSAEQVDHFVFRAEAGAFYELSTDDGVFAPDNMLSLYDAERRLLAQNDDGSAGWADGVDSRLVFRAAQSGDYYLKVEDIYTPPSFFKGDFKLLYYRLRVRQVSSATPGYAEVKADGSSEAIFQHDDQTGYDHVTLLGLFGQRPATCSFVGAESKALIGHALLGGAEQNGSTFTAGRVEVAGPDAGVLARIDRVSGQENIHPPVGEGRHTVRVDAQDGGLGDNPYYVIDLVQLPDNPREQAEQTNGTLAGAETIAVRGAAARRGLLLTRLPAGDVDYYRFDLAPGDAVRVGCESESAGSGVRTLTAEIRDATDTKLSSASETKLENLMTPQVGVGVDADASVDPDGGATRDAGTAPYYLRLSAAVDSPVDAVEPWVRCVLLINR